MTLHQNKVFHQMAISSILELSLTFSTTIMPRAISTWVAFPTFSKIVFCRKDFNHLQKYQEVQELFILNYWCIGPHHNYCFLIDGGDKKIGFYVNEGPLADQNSPRVYRRCMEGVPLAEVGTTGKSDFSMGAWRVHRRFVISWRRNH